jgi:hypothetical protein
LNGTRKADAALGCVGIFVLLSWIAGFLFFVLQWRFILTHWSEYWSLVGRGLWAGAHQALLQHRKALLACLGIALAAQLSGVGAAAFAALVSVGRIRRPRVFVSYGLAREHEARALVALGDRHLVSYEFLPFDNTRGRDQVNQEVRKLLRRSDFVVCFPAAAASYVDAEIFVASELRKPVMFVLADRNDTVPNTAESTYPVLDGECLRASGFASLGRFIGYLWGSPPALWNLLRRSTLAPLWIWIAPAVALAPPIVWLFLQLPSAALMMFGPMANYFERRSWLAGDMLVILIAAGLTCASIALGIGRAMAVRGRFAALRALQADVADGRYAYAALADIMLRTRGLRDELACFAQQPSLAHFERS